MKHLTPFEEFQSVNPNAQSEKTEESSEVKESLDHAEVLRILDAAAMFADDAHVAADQTWWDKKDLVDYLLSDHIPKKYHKEFLKYVK